MKLFSTPLPPPPLSKKMKNSYISGNENPKNFLYFLKIKNFSYISENWNLEKILYISGSGKPKKNSYVSGRKFWSLKRKKFYTFSESKYFVIITKRHFFSFYDIIFYTQQDFVFHLLRDFWNIHDHNVPFFLFLL